MAAMTLGDWLDEAPYALAMSAGFFGFFAHSGVLAVIEERRRLPARVSGASAGALATGLWASGIDASGLERELTTLKRADFWDPRPGLGLLKGRKFRAKLDGLVGDATYETARIPAGASVFEVRTRTTHAITSGSVAAAIHASCALPVLFHPVRLEGRLMSDGGIADRPGFLPLGDAPRVLSHHLASKSPWRRSSDPQLQVTKKPGYVHVIIDGLPRASPFKLEAGRAALVKARDAFRRALDQPIVDDVVRVVAD